MLTVSSLFIVAIAAFSIFAPPQKSLALEAYAETIPSDRAVIYGTVLDTEGKPVRGANIVVVYENGSGPVQIAALVPEADGTFRVETDGPFGTHRVIVSAAAGRQTARDSISLDVQAGNAYQITAELISREFFTFLPVSGY